MAYSLAHNLTDRLGPIAIAGTMVAAGLIVLHLSNHAWMFLCAGIAAASAGAPRSITGDAGPRIWGEHRLLVSSTVTLVAIATYTMVFALEQTSTWSLI